jgi:hypothetical protein
MATASGSMHRCGAVMMGKGGVSVQPWRQVE